MGHQGHLRLTLVVLHGMSCVECIHCTFDVVDNVSIDSRPIDCCSHNKHHFLNTLVTVMEVC